MVVRLLYPPTMNLVPNPLRWCALPLVFAGAICVGLRVWFVIESAPLPDCSPRFAGFGEANGSVACGLLLAVPLLLKMGASLIPGASAVLLCAAAAPARKGATACVVAIGICTLQLLYFCISGYPSTGVGWVAFAAFALTPWLATWLVFRLTRQPPRLYLRLLDDLPSWLLTR